MSKESIQAIKNFISSRQEIAFKRVFNNKDYTTVVDALETDDDKMREILNKTLTMNDRTFVLRHFEKDGHRRHYEYNEVYFQGLRDALGVFMFLLDENVTL